MELREYAEIFWRRWTWIAFPVLLGVGLAALLLSTAPARFESTSTLFYLDDGSASSSDGAAQRLASYVTLVDSARVAATVREELHLTQPLTEVQEMLSGSTRPNTLLLDITATTDERDLSRKIAAATATQIVDLAAQLEASRVQPSGGAPARLTLAQEATDPHRVGGGPRSLVLAALLGLVAGVVLALTREALDGRLGSVAQLRHDTGLPALATIPEPRRKSMDVLDGLGFDPSGRRAEAFRRLRLSLQLVGSSAPPTVVVTGCGAEDAVLGTVCGLGETLDRAGMRVVLVGVEPLTMDPSRPASGRDGLAEVLLGSTALEDALVPWGSGQVKVLPRGRAGHYRHELIGSDAMVELAARLEEQFDIVFVHAPPLRDSVDAAIFGAATGSGIVVVVRSRRTRREHVREAVDVIRDGRAQLLGFVMSAPRGRLARGPSGVRGRVAAPAPAGSAATG